MPINRDYDFSELDGLIAENILRSMGGERARRAVLSLIQQGASRQVIVGRLREVLPTWEQTAVQLGVVVDFLMAEHAPDSENGRGKGSRR